MTTQYTPILKLALPVQGELSGTWGDTVNDSITSLVEEAVAGRSVIDSWTANSHTLTTANGAAAESRSMMLEFTDTGTALTGAGTVICPSLSKVYIAKNASGQSITLKTAAGTGIAVPNGRTMFLFCDGTNVLEAVTNIQSLQLGTGSTVTVILDEDNMASDSPTALATQQSIKAYVDGQVGSFDTLAEVLANGNTTGGNDISFDDNDKAIFGAGSDLQIYHSSSESWIKDVGAGDFYIDTNGAAIRLTGNASTTQMIAAVPNDAVYLYHNNSPKLTTTATGVDVSSTDATVNFVSSRGTGATHTITTGGANSLNFNITAASSGDIYVNAENKIFRNAAGSTEHVRIDSSGNVGIGVSPTTSYGTVLQIHNPAATGSNLRLTNSTSGSGINNGFEIIQLGVDDYLINREAGPMIFSTSNTEAMRIDSSGNVGIGTSSVSSATKLEVYGNSAAAHVGIRANNAAADGYATLWLSNAGDNTGIIRGGASAASFANQLAMLTGSAMPITFSPNNTEAMRITSSGNVGIGTTSPSSLLHLDGTTPSIYLQPAADTEVAAIRFRNAADNNTQGMIEYNYSENSMSFRTNGVSDRLFVDSSGQVLIGTTVDHSSQLTLGKNGGSKLVISGNGNTGSEVNKIEFRDRHTATYPEGQLGSYIYGHRDGNTASHYLTFGTVNGEGDADEAMRIDSSGNVGIGTTSPASYGRLAVMTPTATFGYFGIGNSVSGGGGVNIGSFYGTTKIGYIDTVLEDGTPSSEQARLQFATIAGGTLTERMRISSSGVELKGSSNALLAMRTTGDAAQQVMGTQYLNNSGAVTAQTFATGDSSSSSVFRIKAIGSIDLIGGDIGVTGAPGDLSVAASGNVGIGTSAPSSGVQLDVRGTGVLQLVNTDTVQLLASSGGSTLKNVSNNPLLFGTNNIERMRIDTSGNVLVGTTVTPITSATSGVVINSAGFTDSKRATTAAAAHLQFANPNGFVGSVTTTGSSTAYNTSSDYRLKENVTADWDATTRLKQLNPVRFNFIADADTTVDGFLAHEVQDVVPEAISGTKDAMRDEEYEVSAATGDIYTPATEAVLDVDGNEVTPAVDEVIHSTDVERPEELAENQQWRETTAVVMGTRSVPDYQGIDQSKLVPLLVKTIQELEARIAALEAN